MDGEVYNTLVLTREYRLHGIIKTMNHILNIAENNAPQFVK
jgi:hypothetical protein